MELFDVEKLADFIEKIEKIGNGLKEARESNDEQKRLMLFQSYQFLQMANNENSNKYNNLVKRLQQATQVLQPEIDKCFEDKIPEKLSNQYYQKSEIKR